MKTWRKKRNQLLGGAIAQKFVVKALGFQTLKRLLPTSAIALSIFLLGSELPFRSPWSLNPTIAQPDSAQPRMQLILTVEKKVPLEPQTGTEFEWQPVSQLVPVLPGEILRYRLIGKNNGSESVSALVLTQPIPPEMVYIVDSATGTNNITFSIDNGATFTANPTISNVNESGQMIRQPAPPESYTHVRWNFERVLSPGQELVGTFQVKVK